ncbi:hypothetical protein [Sulfuricurvum sp.]|uniref:hypothetical protein n=1 Tax=Sulfuricurvum sp. TaxID=2025608 RepID=UPI003562A278
MDESNQELIIKQVNNPSRQELKKQRVDELLDSCKDEVIKQIIGPFGLTPAMFDDKDGGNVTTRHNFEKSVVATDEDQARYDEWQSALNNNVDRKLHDKAKDKWKKDTYQSMHNGQEVIDEYTGKVLGVKTGTTIDKQGNRIDAEHITSVGEVERDSKSHLFATGKDTEERLDDRVKISSDETNLIFAEGSMNSSKGDQDLKEWANAPISKDHAKETGNPNMTNAEYYKLNPELAEKAYKESKKHIKHEQGKKQAIKQGKELLLTGAEEAGRNALRQAMGLVLHEFVNSSFIEVKRIANDPTLKENFVDHLIEAMRNIIEKIKAKAEHILKSVLSGGVQGFISNLLTFIINNIVTTSAKIVTVIREGLKGLWEAVKLIMNPPKDMSGVDVARNASKIIATVITTSLGIIFEKSIEAFLLSIPILAPLAPFISPVITGLLTGVVTALVIFAIDKFFDWLNESGTEMLSAQIEYMEANVALFEHVAQMVESQFNNSKQYQLCIAEYNQIEIALSESNTHLNNAVFHAEHAVTVRATTLSTMKEGLSNFQRMDDELDSLLLAYEQNKKEI